MARRMVAAGAPSPLSGFVVSFSIGMARFPDNRRLPRKAARIQRHRHSRKPTKPTNGPFPESWHGFRVDGLPAEN
jgi:hypothetical protein